MRNTSFDEWAKKVVLSAKEKGIPVVGQYELTACCNLDCKMCYIHNADSNALRKMELSTETWKRIFDEAYDMGLMFATLTGGECLLRPDFKELYLYLWKKRISITIFSNGTLINEDFVAFFKKYPPRKVRISLYGSSEEGYRNVTGHNGFEKAVAAVRMLQSAKIPVSVSITPSRYMKDDFINICRFCDENGIVRVSSNFFLTKNRADSCNDDFNLTIEEIVDLSKQEAVLTGKLTPANVTPEPCGTCIEAPIGLPCNAGRGAALVSWDGKMYPCASIPVENASLLEMSYAEAWEITKKTVSEMLLGMECVGCAYDNTCPKCPVMRLKDLKCGHCNPDVCQLTRKLVESGVKKLISVSDSK